MGPEAVKNDRAKDAQTDEEQDSVTEASDENHKSKEDIPVKSQPSDKKDKSNIGVDGAQADESQESEKNGQSELEKLKKEKEDYYDRLLRASAELDNYKKRANREMSDLRKYANESLTRELLSVVDNLERAITMSTEGPTSAESILEGVEMTLKEILKILEKFHVKPIESLGETFDPRFHQAVGQEESQESPASTITKELQKGYMIHDRLLRPAMVIVSKGKPGNEDSGKTSDQSDSKNK